MKINEKREIKRRPRKGSGYDNFFLSGCRFHLIINGLIHPNEYKVRTLEHGEPKTWNSMYYLTWEQIKDFIDNVVWGYIHKRVSVELNFARYRAYLKPQAFCSEAAVLEEYGMPEVIENYTDSVAEMCYAILHERYPLCIDFESCGLFSEDEKNSKVVIKVL